MSKSSRQLLIVVDMQNDFITGSLGTAQAQAIVPRVIKKVQDFPGTVLFTRDSHEADYSDTQEGRLLPVAHCQTGSEGWQIQKELDALRTSPAVDKPAFGSLALAEQVGKIHQDRPLESITLVGLCTNICVISNALIIKAALPEVMIIVDAACCAGVTPQSHRTALAAMKACQIFIENEA